MQQKICCKVSHSACLIYRTRCPVDEYVCPHALLFSPPPSLPPSLRRCPPKTSYNRWRVAFTPWERETRYPRLDTKTPRKQRSEVLLLLVVVVVVLPLRMPGVGCHLCQRRRLLQQLPRAPPAAALPATGFPGEISAEGERERGRAGGGGWMGAEGVGVPSVQREEVLLRCKHFSFFFFFRRVSCREIKVFGARSF